MNDNGRKIIGGIAAVIVVIIISCTVHNSCATPLAIGAGFAVYNLIAKS